MGLPHALGVCGQELGDGFQGNDAQDMGGFLAVQDRQQSWVLPKAFQDQIDRMVRVHMRPIPDQQMSDRLRTLAGLSGLLQGSGRQNSNQVLPSAHQQALRWIGGNPFLSSIHGELLGNEDHLLRHDVAGVPCAVGQTAARARQVNMVLFEKGVINGNRLVAA